jgi:RimJ/RimL family protein N-acetyltransferase
MLFYPEDAPIPAELRTDLFLVRPLRASDAELDYEAYMSSPETIAIHSGGRWPMEGFTVAEDRRLAEQHERDHHARRNFAFIVMTPAGDKSLGCVYVLPLSPYLQRIGADEAVAVGVGAGAAMVTFWLRQGYEDTDFSRRLVEALREWFRREWTFARIFFRANSDEVGSLQALESAGLFRLYTLATDYPPHEYYLYGEA